MTDDERRRIRVRYGQLANLTASQMAQAWNGEGAPPAQVQVKPPATAPPKSAALPDSEVQRLLEIQKKRLSELTDADHRLLARAIRLIKRLLRRRPGGDIARSSWRRRLMVLGHDPLFASQSSDV